MTVHAAAAGEVSTDYWVTVATVVPVLALALVFEIRALSQRWSEETPSWLMVTQATLWAALLVNFAWLMPAAMRGVRGRDMPSWLPSFSEYLVAYSVAILLASPALEVLVRASARQVAALLTLDAGLRLSAWKYMRQVRTRQAELEKEKRKHEQAVIESSERFLSMETRLASADRDLDVLRKAATSTDCEEVRQHLVQAESAHAQLTQDVESARQEGTAMHARHARILDEHSKHLADVRSRADEALEALRQNRAALRRVLTRDLLNGPDRSDP